MAASHADLENMKCAVCTEVYTSPRFLSCYHTFCLKCLEGLTDTYRNVIPCPICRASTHVPTGGVTTLQVNFYLTDEALQRARNAADNRLCPAHPNKYVDLLCIQCGQVICLRCMVTRHNGHAAEELSIVAARSKETIKKSQHKLDDTIGRLSKKLQTCQNNERRAPKKGTALQEQILARHDAVVAMAGRYRDQALKKLQEVSDSVQELLATDTRRVQDELNSLLQLQVRVQLALSTACDAEIWEVGKEMTEGQGSAERLEELEAGLPETTYRAGLHGDFTNEMEEDIKRFIGSPVKLEFPCLEKTDVVRVGQCGEGEFSEVHALQEREDQSVRVAYGGPGGDFSKETGVSFLPDGSKRKNDTPYGAKVSYVAHKSLYWDWKENRYICAKGDRMFIVHQNCSTGDCSISTMVMKSDKGKNKCINSTFLIKPKVHLIHNFDSNKAGNWFAVIDNAKSSDELRNNDHKRMVKNSSRAVHLYSTTSDTPAATYSPPQQPFFPTDVCFFRDDLLLIADWMNDSVHVVKVTDNSLTFVDYLPASGDIVRPTALNLDLSGQLLIGCGDGWVLKYHFDIF